MFNDEFFPFPKIHRWSRDIVITEKIDGTNACIEVNFEGTDLRAGSRTRWITPEDDNYGFARWAQENKQELLKLGPGLHYGEWWGQGIQRKYGLKEKRFSLFNTHRWSDDATRPACCHVVPVLYQGPMSEDQVLAQLYRLGEGGSVAAPGFKDPEGIVIFHVPSQHMFKKTLKKDEEPKGKFAQGGVTCA